MMMIFVVGGVEIDCGGKLKRKLAVFFLRISWNKKRTWVGESVRVTTQSKRVLNNHLLLLQEDSRRARTVTAPAFQDFLGGLF